MQRQRAQKARRRQLHPQDMGTDPPPGAPQLPPAQSDTHHAALLVSLHTIIALAAVATFIAVVVICIVACPRAPRATQRGRAHTVPGTGPPRRPHHRRHLMHYLDGRARGHARTGGEAQSHSFSGSLAISPSHPAIFAIGKDAQRCVKVVLTPPTPARAGGGAPGAR